MLGFTAFFAMRSPIIIVRWELRSVGIKPSWRNRPFPVIIKSRRWMRCGLPRASAFIVSSQVSAGTTRNSLSASISMVNRRNWWRKISRYHGTTSRFACTEPVGPYGLLWKKLVVSAVNMAVSTAPADNSLTRLYNSHRSVVFPVFSIHHGCLLVPL